MQLTDRMRYTVYTGIHADLVQGYHFLRLPFSAFFINVYTNIYLWGLCEGVRMRITVLKSSSFESSCRGDIRIWVCSAVLLCPQCMFECEWFRSDSMKMRASLSLSNSLTLVMSSSLSRHSFFVCSFGHNFTLCISIRCSDLCIPISI